MDKKIDLEQERMEKTIRESLELLRKYDPDTLNEMLKLRFYACDAKERTLTLRTRSEPWMANPMKGLHGGIAASYLDFAMGVLCIWFSNGHFTPTIHMDIHYLNPVAIGDTVLVKAKVTKSGASVCFTEAAIFAEEDPKNPLVTAAAVYHISHSGPSIQEQINMYLAKEKPSP